MGTPAQKQEDGERMQNSDSETKNTGVRSQNIEVENSVNNPASADPVQTPVS
jgi:hypothetical protein